MFQVSANNRRNKNEILEMGNRQFSTITELLTKLKDDLTLSFPSFIREFIGDPNDGVTHLLDALKAIQLAQSNITGKVKFVNEEENSESGLCHQRNFPFFQTSFALI